jgi:hypothetical protein
MSKLTSATVTSYTPSALTRPTLETAHGPVRPFPKFSRRPEGATALLREMFGAAALAADVGHLDLWSLLGLGVAEV